MNSVSTPADTIITQWLEITRMMRHRVTASKTASTMNHMQMHALLIIKEHDGLTMKEFATHLHITSPSATSFANRLVRMKWIKRVADKTNRKLVRLKLSEEGMKCVASKMKEHTRVMRELFSLLSVKDQREFARILKTLRETLAKQPEHS